MELTMPQAIMLNHAAWVSHKNSEKRSDAKAKLAEKKKNGIISTPTEKAEADYVENLDAQSMSRYMATGFE